MLHDYAVSQMSQDSAAPAFCTDSRFSPVCVRPKLLAVVSMGAPEAHPSTKAMVKSAQGMQQLVTSVLAARREHSMRWLMLSGVSMLFRLLQICDTLSDAVSVQQSSMSPVCLTCFHGKLEYCKCCTLNDSL